VFGERRKCVRRSEREDGGGKRFKRALGSSHGKIYQKHV
jgi:hypothetical protein